MLAFGTPAEIRRQAGEDADHSLDMERALIAIVQQSRKDAGGEGREAA